MYILVSSRVMLSGREAISTIVGDVKEKPRKFVETIELQIGLKNYDPQKDKRFSGSVKLPRIPRPKMKICMLGDALHVEEADKIGLDWMDVEALKKLNKNMELVKTSQEIPSLFVIKQIPRLWGPGFNKAGNWHDHKPFFRNVEFLSNRPSFKDGLGIACVVNLFLASCLHTEDMDAGKFPTRVTHQESLESKVNETKAMVKFQLKKVVFMGVAVGNCSMEDKQIFQNVHSVSTSLFHC
ncbi:hypothetical protein CRYUN_Cryun05aG0221200 [Craigia yunnanensis]